MKPSTPDASTTVPRPIPIRSTVHKIFAPVPRSPSPGFPLRRSCQAAHEPDARAQAPPHSQSPSTTPTSTWGHVTHGDNGTCKEIARRCLARQRRIWLTVSRLMRARTIFLQTLLAVACIALGIVIDRRLLVTRRAAAPPDKLPRRENVSAPTTNTAALPLPVSTGRSAPIASIEPKLTSLAQVELAMQAALTNRLFAQRQAALEAIVGALDPSLIAETLSLTGSIPAGPLRADFFQMLMGRWAEHE